MPSLEPIQYSYIRALREVEPSPSLDEFFARARTIAKKVFGLKGTWVQELPASLEEALQPDFQREYEGTGALNVTFFAASSLRATLFERRARPSEEVNEIIPNVFARMNSPYVPGRRSKTTVYGKKVPGRRRNTLPEDLRQIQADAGLGRSDLTVVSRSVVNSTKPGYISRGIEYALAIDANTDAAKVVQEQAALIERVVRKTVVGNPLFGNNFEEDGDVLHIPYIQTPRASEEAHEFFLGAMNQVLATEFADSSVTVALRDVEWDSKARPAN